VDAAKLSRPFGADLQQGTASPAQNNSKRAKLLIVTLAANAPVGAVQSSVFVTTARHQILRLPVFGFVERPH
jgi:hypothetical protein